MKIGDKPAPSGVAAAGRTGGARRRFRSGGVGQEVDRAAPVTGVGALSSVDGLLTAQEVGESGAGIESVPEPREQPPAAQEWSAGVIDELTALRDDLLWGRIPRARLEHLEREMHRRREIVGEDPALRALLTDIEARASVELAKMRRA